MQLILDPPPENMHRDLASPETLWRAIADSSTACPDSRGDPFGAVFKHVQGLSSRGDCHSTTARPYFKCRATASAIGGPRSDKIVRIAGARPL